MIGVRNILLLLCITIAMSKSLLGFNPYSILQVKEEATLSQIQRQYKRLRSKNRSSRSKKSMIRKAYNQILFQRQFNTQEQVARPRTTYFPQHIDQTYVYGYKLSDEFTDGSYFKQNFNETRFIIEKQMKSDTNKKTASVILLLGGFLLKLAPCFIFCCLCRRGDGMLSNALDRARAGYVNIGRRGSARI